MKYKVTQHHEFYDGEFIVGFFVKGWPRRRKFHAIAYFPFKRKARFYAWRLNIRRIWRIMTFREDTCKGTGWLKEDYNEDLWQKEIL